MTLRKQANNARTPRRSLRPLGILLLAAAACSAASAQLAVQLPAVHATPRPGATTFRFVSNGPLGSGWGNTNRIPRVYFHHELPAFFRRTLVLQNDVPAHASLSWIFTGRHAGFTLTLDADKLRVLQRYYDSYALYGPNVKGNFPQKITSEESIPYIGHPRTLTVVMNSHLGLQVWLNGVKVLDQRCLFDVSHSQLLFDAPHSRHLVLAGALQPARLQDTTISVTASKTYQTMLGFGGSPSIPAYLSLSPAGKKRFWQILKEYNLLIDREYPMGTRLKPDMSNLANPADASPHYYGDNFPNGELSNFGYSRKIQQLGGFVQYEMWDLPPWTVTPGHGPSGQHGVANPNAYARAMVTYCRIAKQRTGHPPAIVGVQNEVTEPPQIALAMVRELRKQLDAAGFSSVKIHMADAPFMYQGTQRALALRQHPAIWKSIDYAAVHEYDYQQFFANPDLYNARMQAMHNATKGKPFLATEICINDPHFQQPSYRIAFNTGQLYQKNLTILDAEELLYCWVILDVEQPTFGASRSLLVPDRYNGNLPAPSSYQLRVLGAYSRHILAGMQRVAAASSNPNLLVTAFRGANGQATIVAMNRSTTAQRLTIQWPGVKWQQLERTSLYLQNADSTVPSQTIIQPGEIVTLSTISVHGPNAGGQLPE